MTESATINRRAFLQASGAAGGAFVLGFFLPGLARAMNEEAAAGGSFAPNAFVRIGSDNVVTIIVGRSEMGQGVLTSLPQLVADELDADWKSVRWEQSPASADYNRPGIPIMITGGSFSVRSSWEPLRKAGATARAMLVAAAAREWGVDPADPAHREQHGDLSGRQAPALRRAGRAGHEAAGARRGQAQGPEGVQDHRAAGEAPRHAGEGDGGGHLRHRREAAGHADRSGGAISRLRCAGRQHERGEGQGRARRQGRGADLDRHRGGGRYLLERSPGGGATAGAVGRGDPGRAVEFRPVGHPRGGGEARRHRGAQGRRRRFRHDP